MPDNGFHYISSEGGPFIIGDLNILSLWRGVSEEGTDYESACETVGDSCVAEMVVGPGNAVIWHTGSAGSAALMPMGNQISLMHYWADDFLPPEVLTDCLNRSAGSLVDSGISLSFPSGCLLAAWAPEDLRTCVVTGETQGEPDGDFSVGGSVLFLRVDPSKTFHVFYRTAEIDDVPMVTIDFIAGSG